MGNWSDEAALQRKHLEKGKLVLPHLLRHALYWANERGIDSSIKDWLPMVTKAMRDTPDPKFSALTKGLFTGKPLVNNAAARKIRSAWISLLNLTPARHEVSNDSKAELLDFIDKSAKDLDSKAPNVRAPRFRKLDFAGKEFGFITAMLRHRKRPKKKSGFGLVALLLLLAVTSKRKR